MNKLNEAIRDIHFFEDEAEKDKWLNHIHPLAKVLVTFWYMILVMSFDKYNLTGLASMCLYPLILFQVAELGVYRAFKQLRVVLVLVVIMGIANPFFDRAPLFLVGGFSVTGGMVSMMTLIMKAIFSVLASYLLIASTAIEHICGALRMMHVPKILVTLILLIYRYIILMLKEAERVTQAYTLRAPGQNGIHYKVWGTLAGHMLLRSMDRAERVYDSMRLRGFTGEFIINRNYKMTLGSIIYMILCVLGMIILRVFPVFEMVGMLL